MNIEQKLLYGKTNVKIITRLLRLRNSVDRRSHGADGGEKGPHTRTPLRPWAAAVGAFRFPSADGAADAPDGPAGGTPKIPELCFEYVIWNGIALRRTG